MLVTVTRENTKENSPSTKHIIHDCLENTPIQPEIFFGISVTHPKLYGVTMLVLVLTLSVLCKCLIGLQEVNSRMDELEAAMKDPSKLEAIRRSRLIVRPAPILAVAGVISYM